MLNECRYFSNNCAIDCYKAVAKNGESFLVEILIPMKDILKSSFVSSWASGAELFNDYSMLYNCYCNNSSTKRAGLEYECSHFSSNIIEYDERKRFSKSYAVVLKNNEKKIIGGAWLESSEKTARGIEEKMHIFLEEIHERKGLGKIIENALEKYCIRPDTAILACEWNENSDLPKKFFESIGYKVNGNKAIKFLK